jgi:hypothetical protein
MSANPTMLESFAELFEESLGRQEMRPGEVITAEVVRIDQNFVVVNAGLKSESYIEIEEFLSDKGEIEVTVGDFVQVAIEQLENGFGETRLSRDRAKRVAAWNALEQALNDGSLVTGTITGKVKGGLTVMTNSVRAFLPGSLVDMRPVKDTTPYEGKTYEFKVIKLDRKRNNVVVSRRAVLEASVGEERDALLAALKEGSIVKGWSRTSPITVLSLTWVASMACCISPTWPGAGFATPPKCLQLATRCRPRSSSSTRKRTVFRSVSSSWAKIPGSASRAATHRPPGFSARSPTSPTTAPLSRSSRASRAWCMSPRWTGPTRTFTRRRSFSWAMKSK